MSTREGNMVLSVEALGQENITKLQQALRDLAATGGAGSAEFEQLADEVPRLGQQTTAIQTVQRLTEETAALGVVQERASAPEVPLKKLSHPEEEKSPRRSLTVRVCVTAAPIDISNFKRPAQVGGLFAPTSCPP